MKPTVKINIVITHIAHIAILQPRYAISVKETICWMIKGTVKPNVLKMIPRFGTIS